MSKLAILLLILLSYKASPYYKYVYDRGQWWRIDTERADGYIASHPFILKCTNVEDILNPKSMLIHKLVKRKIKTKIVNNIPKKEIGITINFCSVTNQYLLNLIKYLTKANHVSLVESTWGIHCKNKDTVFISNNGNLKIKRNNKIVLSKKISVK
jgi:hypothetical protein